MGGEEVHAEEVHGALQGCWKVKTPAPEPERGKRGGEKMVRTTVPAFALEGSTGAPKNRMRTGVRVFVSAPALVGHSAPKDGLLVRDLIMRRLKIFASPARAALEVCRPQN